MKTLWKLGPLFWNSTGRNYNFVNRRIQNHTFMNFLNGFGGRLCIEGTLLGLWAAARGSETPWSGLRQDVRGPGRLPWKGGKKWWWNGYASVWELMAVGRLVDNRRGQGCLEKGQVSWNVGFFWFLFFRRNYMFKRTILIRGEQRH